MGSFFFFVSHTSPGSADASSAVSSSFSFFGCFPFFGMFLLSLFTKKKQCVRNLAFAPFDHIQFPLAALNCYLLYISKQFAIPYVSSLNS